MRGRGVERKDLEAPREVSESTVSRRLKGQRALEPSQVDEALALAGGRPHPRTDLRVDRVASRRDRAPADGLEGAALEALIEQAVQFAGYSYSECLANPGQGTCLIASTVW
jgi:hypothetical protein